MTVGSSVRRRAGFVLATAVLVVACGGSPVPPASPPPASVAPATATSAAIASPAASPGPTTPVAASSPVPPAASAHDYVSYKGGAARTGESAGPAPTGALTKLWSVATHGEVRSSPAVFGEWVYVVGGDGHLRGLDLATGAERWSSDGATYVGSPTVGGDEVIVLGQDGGISALGLADGRIRWHTAASISLESWPIVTGGLAIAGSTDSRLHAYDVKDGTERWASTAAAGEFTRGPSSDGKLVFAGTSDGTFRAVALATGKDVWNHATTAAYLGTSGVRDGLVVVNARTPDDYAELFAFDAASGKVRWRFATPDRSDMSSPSIDGSAVYVATASSGLFALKVSDGSVVWTAAALHSTEPIVLVGDEVVTGDPEGSGGYSAVGLDKAKGTERWRFDVRTEVQSPIVATAGRVLVGTLVGDVLAIGGPDLAAGAVQSSAPAPSAGGAGTGQAATLVASFSGAPGGLTKPADIAIDSKGATWVLEAGAADFAIFGADGVFKERWGRQGSGNGAFAFARVKSTNPWGGLAFDASGGFYVADSANFRVQYFNASRTWIRTIGRFGRGSGQFLDPVCVAVGPDGRVYVVDDARDDVQVFSASGTYERTIGAHGSGPGQLRNAGGALIAGDRLFVTDFDDRRVEVFGLDGTFVRTIVAPGFDSPTMLDLGPDGRIYLADSADRIHVFDPDGSHVDTWTVGVSPSDLHVLADGRVVIADYVSGAIGIYKVP
jgi:outer membrane protein assembly factor BamB